MEMEEEGGKFEVSVPTSHDQTQNKANQSVLPKVLYANMDNSVGKSTLISVKLNTSSVAAENSDALFGPWMVANTRRQRQQSSSTGNKPTVVSCLRAATGFEGGDEQRMATDMGAVPPRVVLNVAYRASKPNKKSKAAQVVAGKAVVVSMVDSHQVSMLEHQPASNNEAHAIMTILEQGHGRLSSDISLVGKNKAVKSRGAKENFLQDLQIRKAMEAKTILPSVLSEWVDNVTSQLNSLAAHADLDPGRSIKVVVPPDDNRDAIQHMDGNVIPLRHYQPMALD
ncbi:hypothetical protein V6N12_046630 [Hibiscus sabdariffa]|uniref:Uncharacterized protein n=1 Tax=Hibiscus sabdariffa TaxID=183260 RepID=A0ABR2AZY4_9ROSI